MKETELTCEAVLTRKPTTLNHTPDWEAAAYHWAIHLKITTETGSKIVTVPYKTGNGLIDKPKNPEWKLSDRQARAVAAGLEPDPTGKGRYKPTVPTLIDICYSLASDWEYGEMSFREFCDEGLFSDETSAADIHDFYTAGCRQVEELKQAGITLELLQRYVPEDY